MKIVEKAFDHTGLTIEMVEFDPPTTEQVSSIKQDIARHQAVLNARQTAADARAAAQKAAAAYKENAA
jgi:hypothetical protein